MPSRLDRETSGIVVMAKDAATGSRLQKAIMSGRVRKVYLAVLNGILEESVVVDAPIGPDPHSEFISRRAVVASGRPALTGFVPLAHTGRFTLARIHPATGRRHQIRVHAAHIGYPVAGDKLYPNADLMMEYIRNDWSEKLQAELPLRRQALHALTLKFETGTIEDELYAPLTQDLVDFWANVMQIDAGRFATRQFGR